MISGKITRVATSSTRERCRGSRSSLPRSQVTSPLTAAGPEHRLPVARRRIVRWRNTIDATPVAATSSTRISPSVSHARMSTRSTLTVLAPCPRRYAASGSSDAIDVPVRAAIAKAASVVTVAPTASANATRGHRFRSMFSGADFGRQCSQHQHEHHQREGLDKELGQRQVRCAVEREDHAAAVAGHPDEQHAGEPIAHHGRAERGAHDQQADDRVATRNPTAGTAGRSARTASRARRPAAATSVDRMTACVAGIEPRCVTAGDPQRQRVGAAHHGVVDAVGVA